MIDHSGHITAVRLDDAVNKIQNRLHDLNAKVWTRAELRLLVEDAYDALCDRGHVLFDQAIIPNVPPTEGYTTDLSKYLAERSPGRRTADYRFGEAHDPTTETTVSAEGVLGVTADAGRDEGEAE